MRSVWMSLVMLAVLPGSGCSTITYTISNGTTGQIEHEAKAKGPGGETYAVAVFYGPTKTVGSTARGDSSDLVDATASAGKLAVELARRTVSTVKP